MNRLPPGLWFVCLVPLVFVLPAEALQVRGFSQNLHRRLLSFPGAPVYPQSPASNPSFFASPADAFHAIGWPAHATDWTRQMALISPRHIIYATHYPLGADWQIAFLGGDGNQHLFGLSGHSPVVNDLWQWTDLTVYTLDAEVDESLGIQPFRVLNLPAEGDYVNLPMVVFGSFVTAGGMTVDGFDTLVNDPGFDTTRFAYFDYDTGGGTAGECSYRGGDSGAPAFVMVGGEPVLIGTASGRDDFPALQKERNYIAFMPAYLTKLDALMEPQGYHVRRVNPGSAAVSAAAPTWTLVPGQAGAVSLSFPNAGPSDAHNTKIGITISPAPDSVSGAGWICEEEAAGQWTCRRGGIAASGAAELSIAWNAVPDASAVAIAVVGGHDSGVVEMDDALPIAQSFDAWIAGASDVSAEGDPDHDGLSNLLEFAFGGDPMSATAVGPGGRAPRPAMEMEAEEFVVKYPRRTDAAARGLSVVPEFSGALGGWSMASPPGTVEDAAPFEPAVAGFEEVTLRIPVSAGARYVRVRVSVGD
ncbi:MAG: hypothetical protein H7A49_03000 [Akkermansiaceae bacterium]|nr:hypothetical protein [Akkermansiaceae bacterium]